MITVGETIPKIMAWVGYRLDVPSENYPAWYDNEEENGDFENSEDVHEVYSVARGETVD